MHSFPPAALAAFALPLLSRAQFLPGCPKNAVIPYELQGFGYVNAGDFRGNYSVFSNGLEHYGMSDLNLGAAISAGVLTSFCVASGRKDSYGLYEFTFAREGPHPAAAMCAIMNFTTSGAVSSVSSDYHLMIDGFPPCVSNGKPPSRLTASGYDHDGALIGRCPGPDVVPAILVQPRSNLTVTVVDDALDARVSFSPSAWVEEYLEGAAVVQTCVLSVSPLAPSATALAGAVAAWQVVYGDPLSGTVSGCGLYAQVGALTGTTPADLVYATNFDSLACPATLLNAPGLTTLRDYFTVPPPPRASLVGSSLPSCAALQVPSSQRGWLRGWCGCAAKAPRSRASTAATARAPHRMRPQRAPSLR